jgi:DNA transformation protein
MDREDLAELFLAFGTVDIRRMFSGFGLFAEDVCFSLFLRGELYLKADETTALRFAEEGSRPFSYTQPTSGKVVTVNSFWRLPERLYDDPEELAAWARLALSVAQRSKAAKPKSKSKGKPKQKPAPKKR